MNFILQIWFRRCHLETSFVHPVEATNLFYLLTLSKKRTRREESKNNYTPLGKKLFFCSSHLSI